ncbi:peptidyl-tRNA hydrolase PTH2-domain-containing protein [Amylostereum chailletii]|nr:peptidyl-tRNA hydrolase PTH2-domain-containing protein [Amylostereum chailletii]
MPSSPTFLISLMAASATAGFMYGWSRANNHIIKPAAVKPLDSDKSLHATDEELEVDGSDDEDAADGELSTVQAGFLAPCKLVLLVRTDLKMTPGKIAAQCSHATLACYKALVKKNPKLVQQWETTGQAKIALKVSSEDQLLELEAIAKSLNLCARSIQDAGRTQVEPGSTTVLGIGPAPVELVNQVTGHLRLL